MYRNTDEKKSSNNTLFNHYRSKIKISQNLKTKPKTRNTCQTKKPIHISHEVAIRNSQEKEKRSLFGTIVL